MPKLAPGMRLLRSLARLAAAATPKLKKIRRKAQPKASAKTTAPLQIRQHTRPESRTAPGKWITAQSTHHLRYWLYLPEREASTQRGWPLLVMLHGCHQSATEFAQGTRMNWLAEQKGFAVLYPQQALRTQGQRCWRWYDRAVQQGGGETAALASLIESVCTQHTIDRQRIYACGISAGAGMAAVLALNHPELIAAVAMHSGPMFGAGHSPASALHVMRHGDAAQVDTAIACILQRRGSVMPTMPALLIQGADDHIVRPVNQRQLAHQWLQLNRLPPSTPAQITVKAGTRNGSRNGMEVQDYRVGRKVLLRVARIEGLGHAWSGGDPSLRFNAKPGPDASRMVLDFLARHRR